MMSLLASIVLSQLKSIDLVKVGITRDRIIYREDAPGYATLSETEIRCFSINGKLEYSHSFSKDRYPTYIDKNGNLQTISVLERQKWISTNQALVLHERGLRTIDGQFNARKQVSRFGGLGFSATGQMAVQITQEPTFPVMFTWEKAKTGAGYTEINMAIPVVPDIAMVAPERGLPDLIVIDTEYVMFFGTLRGPINEARYKAWWADLPDATHVTVGKYWGHRDNNKGQCGLYLSSTRTGYTRAVAKFSVNTPLESVTVFGTAVPDRGRQYLFFNSEGSVYRLSLKGIHEEMDL